MNRNITATILIVAAIGIYFTVTKPIMSDAQAVSAQNAKISDALASANQIITTRESITQQYNSISTDNRAKLDRMIPSAVDNIRLVIDLNNIALQNHFSLDGIKASVPSSGQTPGASGSAPAPQAPPAMAGTSGQSISQPVLDKVNVTFSATTGYDQFINFMKDIESDLRIMDLTHLSVTANADGTYTFDVAYQTYWLRQ